MENLLFAKDFGLFCFVFAMTGSVICENPSHFITIKAQTIASFGKPRRPVAALGSAKSKLLKSLT